MTAPALYLIPYVWNVSGGNGVPAINYTYTATRPSYTGYNTLPDTIKLSQNNVISLTGISGADEIVITIFGSGFITKNLPGSTTSVTLTTSELSSLSPTTSAFLIFSCSKNGYQVFSGQYYKFKTGYEIYKSVVVQ